MTNRSLSTLSKIIIFCKELDDTSVLYTYCLGLKIVLQGPDYLELADKSNQRIIFYKISGFSQLLKGYSPMLSFRVDDFNQTLQLLKQYGAKIENEPSVNSTFRVAVFQGINGEIFNIYSGDETDQQNNESIQNNQDNQTMTEIQLILKKLQI